VLAAAGVAATVGISGISPAAAQAPAMAADAATVSPVVIVDALNGVLGKHMARGSNAKGSCMAGQFEAAATAAAITRARMLEAGQRTPLIGRFSIGDHNPKAPDNAKSVCGIAVRLDDGKERLEWIFVSVSHFFAQTSVQFAGFLQVRAPDPATGKMNLEAIAAF
jgi:catalase